MPEPVGLRAAVQGLAGAEFAYPEGSGGAGVEQKQGAAFIGLLQGVEIGQAFGVIGVRRVDEAMSYGKLDG